MAEQIGSIALVAVAGTKAAAANPIVPVNVPLDNPEFPTIQVNDANSLPTPPVKNLFNDITGIIINQQHNAKNQEETGIETAIAASPQTPTR